MDNCLTPSASATSAATAPSLCRTFRHFPHPISTVNARITQHSHHLNKNHGTMGGNNAMQKVLLSDSPSTTIVNGLHGTRKNGFSNHNHRNNHHIHHNKNNNKNNDHSNTLKAPVPTAASSTSIVSALHTLYTPPATPPPSSTLPSLRIECQVRARIPTADGEFFLYLYKNNRDDKEHLAIVFGDDIRSRSLDAPREGETDMDRIVRGAYTGRLRPLSDNDNVAEFVAPSSDMDTVSSMDLPPPLVRIHSECFTGETVHSARCDCGEQLDEAMRLMQQEGRGVIVYLKQEGRGIGLLNKLKAYNLQDLGHDTVAANLLLNQPADGRRYDIATAILTDLSLDHIRLLTNNPDKIEQIEADGLIKVIGRVPMVPAAWSQNIPVNGTAQRPKELDMYLKVKVERMRHLIDIPPSLKN